MHDLKENLTGEPIGVVNGETNTSGPRPANSNNAEPATKPYFTTLKEWQKTQHQKYEAIKERKLEEITRLFNAYCSEKSVHNEHDLLKWVTDTLIVKARASYRRVWHQYPSVRKFWPEDIDVRMASESRALECAMVISEKLQRDFFESPSHLMGHIGNYCKQFSSDALTETKPKAREIRTKRFFIKLDKDDEGRKAQSVDFEREPKLKQNSCISHSLSAPLKPNQVEHTGNYCTEFSVNLPAIPEGEPHDYLTRENRLFLRYCSASDVELFDTLQALEWNPAEAARHLNLRLDTVHKQKERIGKHFQEMRQLLVAFKLPGTHRVPFEHKDDLTERFVNFVGRLQGLTRPEFPKTFDQAYAMCADDVPFTETAIDPKYEPDEVVNHLLRLWRKTQTIQ